MLATDRVAKYDQNMTRREAGWAGAAFAYVPNMIRRELGRRELGHDLMQHKPTTHHTMVRRELHVQLQFEHWYVWYGTAIVQYVDMELRSGWVY